jgi:Fe-S cluster assembly protein SufD
MWQHRVCWLFPKKKSDVTIIEDHIGLADNKYMTIPVCEIKVKQGAHIHHARIQRDSLNAVHVSRPIAYVEKDSEYHSYTITLGAKLTRNEPKVIQEDEEVDFTLDGLVLIDGDQIADTHSTMDHKFSHADSHQLHKWWSTEMLTAFLTERFLFGAMPRKSIHSRKTGICCSRATDW